MARPVYTVPFFIYGAPDSPTSFEVPPGYTAVIRDMTGLIVAGGASYFQINVASEAGTVPIYYRAELSALAPIAWTGRVAVPENYIIEIDEEAIVGVTSLIMTGYLLTNSG